MFEEIIILEVPLESTNGTSLEINDSRITADHVILETIFDGGVGKVTQTT